jgi:hypothetical protein
VLDQVDRDVVEAVAERRIGHVEPFVPPGVRTRPGLDERLDDGLSDHDGPPWGGVTWVTDVTVELSRRSGQRFC